MGQKCSCLFSKDKDQTYYFNQPKIDDNISIHEIQKGKTGEIVNREYNKALSNKTKEFSSFKGYNSNEYNSVNESSAINLNDKKFQYTLIRLQSLARGFIRRRKFKKEKKKLKEDVERLLEKYETNFRTGNIFKAESLYNSPYDPSGWVSFYQGADTSKFKVDYGKVYDTKILIYDNSYYTGQVNIKYQKNGYGKYITRDGSKYQGFWVKNDFTGWGRAIDTEGSLFQGKF